MPPPAPGTGPSGTAPSGSAETSSTVGIPRRGDRALSGRRLPAAVVGLLGTARRQLAERGWTLLPAIDFGLVDRGLIASHERAVLDLASEFGVPSTRDGGRAVWPVTPAALPNAASPRATFSARAGAAGFHTDAQYHDRPEDYVCLFVVRPAADGGLSRLLAVEPAISALKACAHGAESLDLMSRPIWRWRIPAEFDAAAAPEMSAMPALMPGPATAGGLRIRWRTDNLDPALPARLHDAASLIGTVFNRAQGAVELQPRPGDVLILDNHRVMHARTWFSDPRRLLLRVRLWRS